MNLNKIGSRGFIVNLLADYLVHKLGKDSSSIIEAIDCGNFIVIKGKTNSEEVLDLSKAISELKEKYSKIIDEKQLTHTIDLIEYNSELKDVSKLNLTLYNTENCVFSNRQMENYFKVKNSLNSNLFPFEINEDEMSYKSEFPFGYSLNQGRLIYYFLKKLFYSIPSNYLMNTITFFLDMTKENENILEVFDNFNDENDNILKSLILDHVDFNFEKLKKEILDLDLTQELFNPTEDFEILKQNKFQMIVI